jgi:5-methylthioadenosine/S-adenosylhomocysteine deaminase
MKAKSADILVENGTVLTLNANNTEISNGAVAISKDTITAIGPAIDFSDWRASQVIDANGGIIMPGLINSHTHASMTCFRGLADDLQLMSLFGGAAGLCGNDHVRYHLLLRYVFV